MLAWIVRGCIEWQARGLAAPESVRAATAEYRAESDVLGLFLADRTTSEPEYPGGTVRVLAGALYKAYVAWCADSGLRHDTQTAFGRELGQRGFDSVKGSGGTAWRVGLRLRTEADAVAGGASDSCDGCDGF